MWGLGISLKPLLNGCVPGVGLLDVKIQHYQHGHGFLAEGLMQGAWEEAALLPDPQQRVLAGIMGPGSLLGSRNTGDPTLLATVWGCVTCVLLPPLIMGFLACGLST